MNCECIMVQKDASVASLKALAEVIDGRHTDLYPVAISVIKRDTEALSEYMAGKVSKVAEGQLVLFVGGKYSNMGNIGKFKCLFPAEVDDCSWFEDIEEF